MKKTIYQVGNKDKIMNLRKFNTARQAITWAMKEWKETRNINPSHRSLEYLENPTIYKVVTDQKKKQNQELKDEVYLLKNRPEFKTIDIYKVKHDKPLFPGGPTSGTWHFKKANQWVPDGRGRLLHYTEEFKRADEDEKKNEK